MQVKTTISDLLGHLDSAKARGPSRERLGMQREELSALLGAAFSEQQQIGPISRPWCLY